MATAKPTAKPAAKTAAPAAKAAPAPAKPAPRPAAKAVPAPAPAPEPEVEATDEVTVTEGSVIRFNGYAESTPEAERTLTEGTEYTVSAIEEVTDEETGEVSSVAVVKYPNPAFNAKKKEHPDTNPKELESELYFDEFEVVSTPPLVEEPAAGKKAAKKAAAVAEPAEPVDPDDLPELENEDPEVLALLSTDDLIGTAQALETEQSQIEWKLGGALYHIRKDKLHRSATDAEGNPVPAYSETGGWQKFLEDYFPGLGYRKAMDLVSIYQHFTTAGVTGESMTGMGWAKARMIAKHVTAEGANPTELVELASTSTVSDLSEALKESLSIGSSAANSKKRVTLKFRYLEEEGNAILTTLETAKAQLGKKDIGEALAHIVTDWATQNGGGKATAASAPKATAAAGAKPAKPVVRKAAAVAA